MAPTEARTAHIIENGTSAFSVTINVSGHTIVGDEPEAGGGANLGPAPYDVLLAALGECTVMTIRWVARQQNWPLEKAEAHITHHKEGRQDVFSKIITLHGPELTEAQREKLIEAAAKCPVQRTLEGTPLIQTVREGAV